METDKATTEVPSPVDGIVAEINSELFEYVTPSPVGIPTPPAVDLIDFAAAQPVLRAELRQALQRLCRTDCMPTAQQLGMALRPLVTAPPAGFTVESVDRRGTTQWLIVDMRDRLPPAPQ